MTDDDDLFARNPPRRPPAERPPSDADTVPWLEEDDGDDYELEPVDPEVLAAEERRAAEKVAETARRVELQQMYEETHGAPHAGGASDAPMVPQFRFQVKHLMIATAVVAVALACRRIFGGGTTLLFFLLVGTGGPLAYMQWKEYQREQAMERKRRRLLAEMRREKQTGTPPVTQVAAGALPDAAGSSGPQQQSLELPEEEPEGDLRFFLRFSLKELFGAITVAVIVFALIGLFGGPYLASTLGLIALVGLAVHLSGVEVPEVVALGWWILLAAYVLVSAVALVLPAS